MSAKPCILIADPVSTGRLYVDDIIRRGYEPIVLMPWLEEPDEMVEAMYEYRYTPMLRSLPKGIKIIWEKPDYQQTLEEIKKYPIKLAISGNEMGINTIDRITHDLGLKGNPIEFSQSHRDKDIMQDALKKAGLRHISGKKVKSVEDAKAFLDETGIEDAIVKPINGAGSSGLHYCSSREEILEAVKHDQDHFYLYANPEKGLIVQERIIGDEYVVNTVSCNGKHVITDIWEYRRVCLRFDGNIYDRVTLVTQLEPKHIALCEYALSVVEALGIKNGPSHGEYMIDEKGPVLIECGARPMGGAMPQSFLDKCLGHHITDISLDSYLDPKAFEEFASKPYRPKCSAMMKFLISKRDRTVADVPLHEIVKNLPSVHMTKIGRLEEHALIKRTTDVDTSPGTLFMVHEDDAVLERDYQIILDLESSCDSMLFGLDDLELENLSETSWNASDALAEVESGFAEDAYTVLTTDAGHCDVAGAVDLRNIDTCGNGAVSSDAGSAAKTAILHMSGSLKEMEGFLRVFADAVTRFKFERFIVTEQSFDHFPYGKRGLAQLMRLNGYKLDLPTIKTQGMLIASRVWEEQSSETALDEANESVETGIEKTYKIAS